MDIIHRVYTWGSTTNGALGCQKKPTKVQPVPKKLSKCCANFIQSNITGIAAGNSVTTVVTEHNEVYSWGNISLKNINTKRVKSCQCNLIPLDGIIYIAHGSSYHVGMTNKHEIYAWGNASHLSGTKSTTKQKWTQPKQLTVTALEQSKCNRNRPLVKQIACSENQMCILKHDGTMITLGRLLGIGGNNRLDNICFKEIACGHNHCAAICSRGIVHTWGFGKNGRLGHGDEENHTNPTSVSYFSHESFATVACGYAHTLVSSLDDGSVYGFGWNVHNQVIGNADVDLSDCLLPITCIKKKGVIKLSCGFAYSAAITTNGSLLTWGMNDDGQCGTGDELNVPLPTKIEFKNDTKAQYVVDISCGHSHTVCVLSNLTPIQWANHVKRLRQRPFAVATIVRFIRCMLFRIRLFNHIKHKKSLTNSQIVIASPKVSNSSETAIISDNDELDTSSSLSTHTSWSDGLSNPEVDGARQPITDNELARRLIEMSRMSDEDQRSQAHMAHLRAIQEKMHRQQTLLAEQKRVKSERDQMLKEDMISKSVRKQIRKASQTKSGKTAINARANAHIQKAANRLKEARERKEVQSKAKFDLPAITRKMTTRKPNDRPALQKVVSNSKQFEYSPGAGHLQRTQQLLKRREKRLKSKQQLEKEADAIRRQKLKEQQERERLDAQLKRKMISDKQKRIEEARRLRHLQKNAEIQRLENELRMKKRLQNLSSENKENESDLEFRPLSHWTRSLYGQK